MQPNGISQRSIASVRMCTIIASPRAAIAVQTRTMKDELSATAQSDLGTHWAHMATCRGNQHAASDNAAHVVTSAHAVPFPLQLAARGTSHSRAQAAPVHRTLRCSASLLARPTQHDTSTAQHDTARRLVTACPSVASAKLPPTL